MTAAACNLQLISRMSRNNLYIVHLNVIQKKIIEAF